MNCRISTKYPTHLCKVKNFIATFAKNVTKVRLQEMTVERDIAGFALPFAAGAAFAAYIPASQSILSLALPAVLLICTALLMHPFHKSLGDLTLVSVIVVLGFSCGGLSALAGDMTSPWLPEKNLLRETAHDFCESIKAAIGSIQFKERESNSIVSALITGDRSSLPHHVTEAFRKSGASHILALSGLHLGIIYGILKWVTGAFGRRLLPKTAEAVLIISACGFYTIATGAGPSITRAFLFILLGETASVTGRSRNTGAILWTALLIQLVFNPVSVRSISFQLSYAAMIGIAYIYPHLRRFWPDDGGGPVGKIIKKTWDSAALSIACQITTAYLAWTYFGTFPRHFLLTNLIALPLTGIIIPSSLGILALDSIGICPDIFVTCVDRLIDVLAESLGIIASL